MKKTMQWLYDNWMKATPFLALYSFILIWLYVKEQNYALFLIWMQVYAQAASSTSSTANLSAQSWAITH